jgi:poly(beta-D-mannuronate) lyase
MKFGRALALFSLALAIGARAGAGQAGTHSLRSPWDVKPVALTGVEFHCDGVPKLPHDVVATSFYSDSKHSVTDPVKKAAYDEARAPYQEAQDRTAKAADFFVKTGSRAAAACVVHDLAVEAQANAMTGSMSSNQAQYVQNWTLGALAISWLKVQQAHAATPEELAAIRPWMHAVASQVETYFEARRAKETNDGRNNHLYWAGFSVMAAGIALDDRALYAWGVSTYKDGVDRIQADGTLPLEMARGQRALHYHLFALAPLVTMAELGEANGDDLYAYNHNKLHLLVSRALAGLVDNSYFTQKAGVKQDTPPASGEIKSDDVEWVRPYERRFPDPMIEKLMQQAGFEPFGYLGGLPPA